MRRSAHDFFRCCILKLVENNHKQSKQCWMVLFLKQLDLFTGEQFTHVEMSAQICEKIQRCAVALGLSYSETQLLRTLKGNEKRYVLTKVLSIQNAIFLTGRIGSTCSRERSATGRCFSVLNVIHHSLLVRWNRLSGHRELENVPGNWNRNWRLDDMLVIRRKRTKESSKKCSWRENWYVLSDFVPRSVCLIRKKMYMFSDWRCPWSTDRTL